MHNDKPALTTRQQSIVDALTQPMTATQLAQRTQIRPYLCGRQLRKLAEQGRVRCLTPTVRRSRIYATREYASAHDRTTQKDAAIDWDLYAWICFSQRSAVLRTLDQPLQSAEIARRARRHDPQLRMSANNVRDVINAFAANGIVEPLFLRKKAHPRYQLTATGRQLQEHLLKVTSPRPPT